MIIIIILLNTVYATGGEMSRIMWQRRRAEQPWWVPCAPSFCVRLRNFPLATWAWFR